MATYTWYITQITRPTGNSDWTTVGQSEEVTVWVGDAAPPNPGDFDIIIIDNDPDNNLVDASEIRAGLANAGYSPSNNSGFIGASDITVNGDTVASIAFSTGQKGIESTLSGYAITLEPIDDSPTDSETFPAEYKGGKGNFKPFFPGSLKPPCFAAGTLLETGRGLIAVEDLQVGDLIRTRDHGMQPIRWIGAHSVIFGENGRDDTYRPIRIAAGALAESIPERDLLVSPQHRVLLRSKIAQTMFGVDEILVPAKQLIGIDGIACDQDCPQVDYYHIMFDRHEIVLSNGAETESFYAGQVSMDGIGAAARAEIYALFPELVDPDFIMPQARPFIRGHRLTSLTRRHSKNHKPLVSTQVKSG